MTTVAQMIEWMKTLPQDAEVECGVEERKGYDTYMKMVPVDIEACDVFDYTSPEDREKYPAMAGKVMVFSVRACAELYQASHGGTLVRTFPCEVNLKRLSEEVVV